VEMAQSYIAITACVLLHCGMQRAYYYIILALLCKYTSTVFQLCNAAQGRDKITGPEVAFKCNAEVPVRTHKLHAALPITRTTNISDVLELLSLLLLLLLLLLFYSQIELIT
jgi:hypothetical protein